MKRLLSCIGHFFWSWGCLKLVLWVTTIIVLFYVEEDWRGARAWAATKRKWEARGETFDLNRFTPPSIPDDQNLAAIPLFKLEPIKPGYSQLEPLRLQRALRQNLPGGDLPPLTVEKPEGIPDMGRIRKAIARNYAVAFPGAEAPERTLDQIDALYPFLHDFLAVSAARPLYRLPADYRATPPALRSLGVVVSGIKLSQILTLQAMVAFDERQPGLALADIRANYIILSGCEHDPTLVGGLVAIGMSMINHTALRDGFALHLWTDDQLQKIDQTLRPVDFLADFQFAMRCEAAESVTNIEWYESNDRWHGLDGFRGWFDGDVPWMSRNPTLWPRGWWEYSKVKMADLLLDEVSAVDPRTHRVFPQIESGLKERVDQAVARWDANAPWSIWSNLGSSALTNMMKKYALAQAKIDEARIAAALERYWLVHKAYPASLDSLTPAFIDRLPRDVMNGELYHYRLCDDGSYCLYSVGWDLKDQNGEVVRTKDSLRKVVYEQGDWPWVTPAPDAGSK